MDVLVIGGTVFLGRAVVGEARALGASVTVFNRGVSGPTPPGVTHLAGDRTVEADLARLAGRSFDVVVDTCGYVPAEVARSAAVLAPTCGRYAFVSTINVYPGWPADADYQARGVHQGLASATRADVPAGLEDAAVYGWLKAGCELAASDAFGTERTSILRGGTIVGPDDSAVGRLPWWLDRISRGGEVLVPGRPADPVSLIDARDLARFALTGPAGVFETSGPERDTRADLLAACVAATGTRPRFRYVDDDWLVEQGVAEWTEVPLWAPRSSAPGLFAHDASGAAAAGLAWRPLAETVADTWVWQRSLPGGWRPTERTPGLAPQREAELLARWQTAAGPAPAP